MRGELSVLGEWFLFSVLMFTLPFISYFGAKHVVETHYPKIVEENAFLGTLIPVVSAVLTVWIVIAAYAYIAWRDQFRIKKVVPRSQAQVPEEEVEDKKDN